MPIGASKIGGCPDLPPGVEWPHWHEPLAFIGQFNLAEVAPFDRERLLPTRGLLSFFYETDGEPLYSARLDAPPGTAPGEYPEIDESPGWRVLYHDADPATFIRHPSAPDLNEDGRFPACAARFATEATLPDVDSPDVVALGLSDDERSMLIDLYYGVYSVNGGTTFGGPINAGTWEEGGHHLLGYPQNVDGSVLLSCVLDLQERPYEEIYHDRVLMRACEVEADTRWQLLLQVGSSDVADMGWAGGGLIYFCIEHEALRTRDFARARLTMEFL